MKPSEKIKQNLKQGKSRYGWPLKFCVFCQKKRPVVKNRCDCCGINLEKLTKGN